MVINIPGNDLEKGEFLSSYVGFGEPKGRGRTYFCLENKNLGPHRYIFLVYRQPGKISDIKREGKTREEMLVERCQYIKDFAKKHNFGDPIAGNFFLVSSPVF